MSSGPIAAAVQDGIMVRKETNFDSLLNKNGINSHFYCFQELLRRLQVRPEEQQQQQLQQQRPCRSQQQQQQQQQQLSGVGRCRRQRR